ncbi:MAG: hypothetical protein ACI80P_001929 [Flavobacteriales bacterium]|jgi:hypothetical protein
MKARKLSVALLASFVLSFALTSCVSQKGFNYKAHSKKGKNIRYKGDLTQYKCGR